MRTLAVLVASIALSLGGCLRLEYDLCEREDPHPECDGGAPRDAGPLDAGPLDAGPLDAGPLDAGPLDAGELDAGAQDAGIAEDSGVDAAPPPDAAGDAS
ncbi:MAG: hypothetical protein M3Y87_33215 [Myxococcota bacterium]|nr:hypothetical protein [Myxococcota bacterium]